MFTLRLLLQKVFVPETWLLELERGSPFRSAEIIFGGLQREKTTNTGDDCSILHSKQPGLLLLG